LRARLLASGKLDDRPTGNNTPRNAGRTPALGIMPEPMAAGSGERRMSMTGSDRHGGLADVLDDHLAAEFATRDVDATMATMTDDPYLNHVPVLTGGIGREEVRRFYEQIFIGHWPADTTMERISRTVGTAQVVDELVISFTHDITMSHLLPGVPPTGRRVRLAVCVVAGFTGGKLTHEHIYWDQACLLVQVGLLDPAGLPVTGAEQAEKLLARAPSPPTPCSARIGLVPPDNKPPPPAAKAISS
jgi:carboxymethylenebutenolidase